METLALENNADLYLTEISNFIFASKYARYLEDKQRRETWEEAVDRVLAMHLIKYSYLSKEDINKIIWAFNLVKEKKIVPSMRSMQFGGNAIFAHNSRMYNCLAKETTFITSHGVKSFNDFNHGDEIKVLTDKGNWKKAIVKNYGKQELYPITIKRVKSEKTIWATKNHTWITKYDERTENLKEGTILKGSQDIFSDFNYDNATVPEKLYWAYGYIYGDGTKVKNNNEYKYSMVRLCKGDNKYLDRFIELGFKYSYPPSNDGDAVVYTGSYLKETPSAENTPHDQLRAFVRGYLDADGSKDKNNNNRDFCYIQSSEKEHIDFIRNVFPIVGQYIVSEEELTGKVTNYGVRPYTIKFCINSSLNNQANSNTPFVVKSIGNEHRYEEVWCLEVEDDQSFVLPFGLVTGNCAVRHIDSLRAFSESFYLLLCGVGVSFGINNKYLSRLPDLVGEIDKKGTTITYIIEDTIEGWADSLEALLMCYFKNTPYTGRKIVFDFSKIRKKGTPLKTGGGKAPGHKGLKQSLERIKNHLDHIIEHKKLNTIRSVDVYDILMHASDAVLSGGIRRAATAVIFDEKDEDMLKAKTEFTVDKRGGFILDKDKNKYTGYVEVDGQRYDVELSKYEYKRLRKDKVVQWHRIYPWRARSNNSVRLIRGKFTKEKLNEIIKNTQFWGEPGFVFADHEDVLFNPCFEISFLPVTQNGECGVQFCNLTSINGAKVTNLEEFLECTEAATIIGTLQAGYTDFPYLSNIAKKLTEQEALLGVSITGYMDNPDILLNEKNQYTCAKYAVKINKDWAAKLYINQAARVTTTKPEGTSSLILKSASGIHPHHAYRYFRRVQTNKQENVYKHFKKSNPHMCEESVWSATKTDDVITFPVEIPAKSMIKDDLTALKHLHIIKNSQENWVMPGTTEVNTKPVNHNISCTVEVKDEEWREVTDYIFENQKFFTALSLLPKLGDKGYQQPPMERVLEEDLDKWNKIVENFKPVDYTTLIEKEDKTELTQTIACGGGACEIDFSKDG